MKLDKCHRLLSEENDFWGYTGLHPFFFLNVYIYFVIVVVVAVATILVWIAAIVALLAAETIVIVKHRDSL